MNDVTELKRFAAAHCRPLGVPEEIREEVFDRIVNDGPDTPGSWVREWRDAGRRHETEGDLVTAFHCYALARFPYVDGEARQAVYADAQRTFDTWRADHPGIERLAVFTPDGERLCCWAYGLSATAPRTLLVITAGLASVKEQWAAMLLLANQLDMAVLVTELPGVGENRLRYDRDAWRMFTAILDTAAECAKADRTYLVGDGLAGHLALRFAAQDRRVRGVICHASPLREFFTDPAWLPTLPRVAADTLAHLLGRPSAELSTYLRDWALTDSELSMVDAPIGYLSSSRDQLTPPGEPRVLRTRVRQLMHVDLDRAPGSPRHADHIRGWIIDTLIRMRAEAVIDA
jgi:esterase FrsA